MMETFMGFAVAIGMRFSSVDGAVNQRSISSRCWTFSGTHCTPIYEVFHIYIHTNTHIR